MPVTFILPIALLDERNMMDMFDINQQRLRFLSIVDEIRIALGYSLSKEDTKPEEELAMEMMYGGFDFAVVHSARNSPQRILIECRFGPLPEGREQQIMLRLLNMNCALAELDASVFCLDPESGDLIYTLSLAIDGMDGNTLLAKMTEIVWHGRRWLETRFMNDEDRERDSALDFSVLA